MVRDARAHRAPGPHLGIHLGMGGRLIVTDAAGERGGGEPVPPGPHPAQGRVGPLHHPLRRRRALRLFDKRRLGRVRLDPDLDALGPDAEMISRTDFRTRVGRGRSAVKARLLDQSVLAGVGNLLADETLWQAALSPSAPADELSERTLDGLYDALEQSLKAAIANGGVHTGEVIEHRHVGGTLPPLRRGDGARHRRRPHPPGGARPSRPSARSPATSSSTRRRAS